MASIEPVELNHEYLKQELIAFSQGVKDLVKPLYLRMEKHNIIWNEINAAWA